MRLFGWSGKLYFLEIEIRWPKKKAFDHGNAFTLLFSLQSISGKWERERESARARAWEEKILSEIASSSSSPRSRSTARSWEGEIAIAISDRDHGAVVGLETFSSLMIFFFWVVVCVFWFVFSFFFSKHQKIFSGKFFEMQPNTWKHFPFPGISIFGKYVFSGKRFTATKHSLNCKSQGSNRGIIALCPYFFKKFSNMSLFWNYLGPCPCFETRFVENRVWDDQT